MSDDQPAEVVQDSAPVGDAAPEQSADSSVNTEAQTETPENTATPEQSVDAEASNGVQKRINKMTAEKYELKHQLEQLKAQINAQPQAPAGPAPTLEQFDFDEARFADASKTHYLQQGMQQGVQQAQQHQVQMQEQAQTQAMEAKYSQKVDEFMAKTPDFAQSVGQLPLSNASAQEAIKRLDNGPAVAYYLSKHLDVADQLNTMDPVSAALAVAQVGQTVSQATQTRKVTTAPSPVGGIGAGGAVGKDMGDMSMAEFMSDQSSRYQKTHGGG